MAYGRYKSYPKPGDEPKKKSSGWNPSWAKKVPIVKIPYKPILHPTDQQMAIIEEVQTGTRNVLGRARAGCAKTSTAMEAIYRMPQQKGVFLAFNNKIAREAEAKCPNANFIVKTHHAYGLAALKRALGKIEVDKDKMDRIIVALVGFEDNKAELRYNLDKCISLCKGDLAETEEDVSSVIDQFGIELCDERREVFCKYVLDGMRMSLENKYVVNFDDMLYAAVKLNVHFEKMPIVINDEAQDNSKARQEVTMRACQDGGKIVFFADDRQTIYTFAGASLDTVDRIIEKCDTLVFPLTITHRCCKAVVRLAQTIVPDYEASSTAPEGEVKEVTEDWMMSNAHAGDVILSRTNSALVPIAMTFLKQLKPCKIQGKDLGKNLLWMLKRSEATDVSGFMGWLTEWKDREVDRLTKRNKTYSHITDKFEVFEAVCEVSNTLDDLKSNISKLFDDNENDGNLIVCSTVHKWKGNENERAFVLMDTFKKNGGGIEEENIKYVSFTRAKTSLFLVGKGSLVNDAVIAEGEKEVAAIEAAQV